ncbi:MAG: glycogen debranching enzyme, partial [Acidobacteriales bacterium]|nr:glycogen debranching enzyme [Terriglobales bacterium]
MSAGRSFPLGATFSRNGVNFALYSRGASIVELLFFDRQDDSRPSRVIPLDPVDNRTCGYWHTFVSGIKSGQLYGYRVAGPWEPERGLRFDGTKLLLDPYAQSVAISGSYNREVLCDEDNGLALAMKSVVVNPRNYNWEGDLPLRNPCARTLIYEMHVKGFTQHPSSGIPDHLKGTYAGVIEKIPYLQELGVTAVELLPVFQFDPGDAPNGKVNYWGYAPISFFAPHRQYSSRQDLSGPVDEFRDMVKALHRARIEVILDVVFNHTAEGGQKGPTLNFRGLDNSTYYILEEDRAR